MPRGVTRPQMNFKEWSLLVHQSCIGSLLVRQQAIKRIMTKLHNAILSHWAKMCERISIHISGLDIHKKKKTLTWLRKFLISTNRFLELLSKFCKNPPQNFAFLQIDFCELLSKLGENPHAWVAILLAPGHLANNIRGANPLRWKYRLPPNKIQILPSKKQNKISSFQILALNYRTPSINLIVWNSVYFKSKVNAILSDRY